MVISRFMRRLLLVTAICLPMQVLPNGAAAAAATTATAASASSTGILGGIAGIVQALVAGSLSLVGGAITGGIDLTISGVSALANKETAAFGAAVAAIYGAPKLYKYVTAVPTTKKVQRQPGSWIGRQAYTVWDAVTDTGRSYLGAGRYVGRKIWNSPTYLMASVNSLLDWDKTNRKANKPLEAYKVARNNNNLKDMPSFGIAIMSGNEKAVDAYLGQLGYGAWEYNDGNQGLSSGITGLMLACRFAHPTIYEKLISTYGGNIDNQDKTGLSALMHAVMIPKEIKARIGQTQDGQAKKTLMVAQEQNRARIVEDLMSRSAHVELKDSKKRNALMYAAASGLYRATMIIADAMETQGFDLNEEDEFGKTALVYAVENGHVNTVKLLLGRYKSNKVNVNRDAANGSDALATAKAILERLRTTAVYLACAQANQQQCHSIVQKHIHDNMQNAELTEGQMRILNKCAMDMIFADHFPIFKNMLEICELLDKASQVEPESEFTISYDVDGLNDGWIQTPNDISADEIGFDGLGLEDEMAEQGQTQQAALPQPVQTPVAALTPTALATHSNAQAFTATAGQPARTAYAPVYQSVPQPVVYDASPPVSSDRSMSAPVSRGARSQTQRVQQPAQAVLQPTARNQRAPQQANSAQQLAPATSHVEGDGLRYTLTYNRGTPDQYSIEVSKAQFDANTAKQAALKAAQSRPAGEAVSSEHVEPGSVAADVQAGNTAAYERIAQAELAKQRQLNAPRGEGQAPSAAVVSPRNGRVSQAAVAAPRGYLAHSPLVQQQTRRTARVQ